MAVTVVYIASEYPLAHTPKGKAVPPAIDIAMGHKSFIRRPAHAVGGPFGGLGLTRMSKILTPYDDTAKILNS